MNPEAALLSTIIEIQDLSHRMFFNSLNCHANKLLDKVREWNRKISQHMRLCNLSYDVASGSEITLCNKIN